MKKIFLLLAVVSLLGCTSDDTFSESSTPPETETPDDGNGDDEEGDNPETPESPEDDIGMSIDDTIPQYSGEKASDASADRVDADDDDYYENSTFTKTVSVTYQDGAAQVEAPEGAIVHTEGAHVVVDLTTNTIKEVEFVLQGNSSDGSLKIYSPNKFKITLNGLTLTSQRGPAINNQSKKRTFVHVADGTVNKLVDAQGYLDDIYYPDGVSADDEDRKGCFFSEAQLVFSGTGSLEVEGRNKHAIVTDDYFRMRPGITIAVTGAVKNGIHAKDGVTIGGGLLYVHTAGAAGKGVKTDGDIAISGGEIQLYTSGDAYYDADEADTSSSSGLKSDGNIAISGGTLKLKSTGSGGKGISCDGTLTVNGGAIAVVTTGGKYIYNAAADLTSSPKGIKAEGDITIQDGTIHVRVTGHSDGSEGIESKSTITVGGGVTTVSAYDDAMNATTDITINDGYVWAYSENNDGIDSNGTLAVNGGIVIASGTSQPEAGFDCDQNRFAITGGIVIGTGGSTSNPTESACQQPAIICNGIAMTSAAIFNISDGEGNSVFSYKFPRTINSGCILVSTTALVQGGQYTISTGGTTTGSEIWKGYCSNGKYSGGTVADTFTLSSMVTSVGQGGGSGNRPGDRPGRP